MWAVVGKVSNMVLKAYTAKVLSKYCVNTDTQQVGMAL